MQHAGQIIREHRVAKGMTQQELATEIKSNVRTIQRIESGEVNARLFTLKAIAAALDIELETLTNERNSETTMPVARASKNFLIWLHLSGFLLLPTLLIWFFEKDKIKEVRQQGADVINFQLSMLAILIPCLALPFIPLLIALFTSAVILINTVKVSKEKPYHYPITISFVKP